ncbi:unnamed protein product, partial [Adineta ricciae]
MNNPIVYVPDIPMDIDEDELATLIQTRVQTSQRMKVHNVKCYSKLGVAIITLFDDNDKNHLVANVQSIVLETDLRTTISFEDKLELDSYIIIDRNAMNIPSVNEVAQHYTKSYKISRICACKTVSDQFPNVFRIAFQKFHELLPAVEVPSFKILGVSATVYSRFDCNFFEDLPLPIEDDEIRSAIAAQIGAKQLSFRSFYVQHNSRTGSGMIVASKSEKKWAKQGFLTINGLNISRKFKLSYRVLVSPVPRDFDINKILNNRLFINYVVSQKLIDDKLVIELQDFDHFKFCLEVGGFGIESEAFIIKPHTVVSDPDSCELDALNWYETKMQDIVPDVTTIIHDYQHPIFRFKWNAQNFLKQMNKAAAIPAKGYDLTKHLLRVTVMLNTIGTLRKKQYIVDDTLVKLKLERIQTIGYSHQSKLFTRKTLSQTDFQTPYPKTTVQVVEEDCLVLYEQLVAKGHRPLLLNMANATSPGGGYRKGDGAQEENIFRRSDYYHSLDGELADRTRSERLYYTPKGELKQLKGFGDFYPMEEFGGIYTAGIT